MRHSSVKNRIVAVLLALAMVFSLLEGPVVNAWAAGSGDSSTAAADTAEPKTDTADGSDVLLRGDDAARLPAIQEKRSSTSAVTLKYDYSLLVNGMAIECQYGCLEQIRAMDGVKDAYVAQTYQLPTPPRTPPTSPPPPGSRARA